MAITTDTAGAPGTADGSRQRVFRLLLAIYTAGGFAVAAWLCWRITHGDLLPDQAVTGRWATLDWLTNYEAGFIRRGLAGEAIIRLSDLIHAAPQDVVFGVMVLAYAAQAGLLYALLRSIPDASAAVFIIFAPFMLGFELLTPGGIGRKDVLFVALMAWLGFSYARGTNSKASRAPEIALAATVVLTFIHEAFFLYSPWVLAFGLLEPESRARRWRLAGLWLLSAVGFGVVVANHGSADTAARLCQSLDRRIDVAGFAAACPTGGAIASLNFGMAEGWRHFRETYAAQTLLTATPLLLLAVAAFVPMAPFLSQFRKRRPAAAFALLTCALAAVGLSLPLFIVADDWGRWIRLHAVAAGIVACALLARGQKEGWGATGAIALGVHRSSGYLALAVLYATLWELNIVGGLVGGGFIGRALGTLVQLSPD